MSTIVNNPGTPTTPSDNSSGWAVAVIILLVVIAGGIFWYMRYHRAAPQNPGTTIQVNLPTGGDTNNGSANGSAQ